MPPSFMEPHSLSLSEKARETIAKFLVPLLAEECSLSATIRHYRWTVTGPHFHSLHKLFEDQRRQLEGWLTLLFQRATWAGVAVRLSASRRETPPPRTGAAGLEPQQMIDDLLTRHEQMSRVLRDEMRRFADPATADLLKKLADFHETAAWMLRMLLEPPESRRR